MTREEAITTLRNVAWLGTDKKVGQVEEALQMAITALQTDGDVISRQEVLDLIRNGAVSVMVDRTLDTYDAVDSIVSQIKQFFAECVEELPSAQPEPFSYAYMKAVWTWLLDYQIKVAELNGRYTPYEVLSWVVNDWRKEHE